MDAEDGFEQEDGGQLFPGLGVDVAGPPGFVLLQEVGGWPSNTANVASIASR